MNREAAPVQETPSAQTGLQMLDALTEMHAMKAVRNAHTVIVNLAGALVI